MWEVFYHLNLFFVRKFESLNQIHCLDTIVHIYLLSPLILKAKVKSTDPQNKFHLNLPSWFHLLDKSLIYSLGIFHSVWTKLQYSSCGMSANKGEAGASHDWKFLFFHQAITFLNYLLIPQGFTFFFRNRWDQLRSRYLENNGLLPSK